MDHLTRHKDPGTLAHTHVRPECPAKWSWDGTQAETQMPPPGPGLTPAAPRAQSQLRAGRTQARSLQEDLLSAMSGTTGVPMG